MELEDRFGKDTPVRKAPTLKPKLCALKKFFKDRKISDAKIASDIGVSVQAVGNWLNKRKPFPTDREEQINALVKEITEWEKEHGIMFNSEVDYKGDLDD